MASARERNNAASKKCHQKELERLHAAEYEHEVVRQHRLLPHTEAWHWSVVPEDCLYEAGYITDYNQHRLQRLMNKKEKTDGLNRLKDYGFDGLARTHVGENDYVYAGLQAKYYLSRQVTAADIGTFLAVQTNLTMKDPRSKGLLYTTSALQPDLRGFVAHPNYRIQHILHPWQHPDKRHQPKERVRIVAECDLPLRPYQKEAIQLFRAKKGLCALALPCRMGKTVIAGHVLQHKKPAIIIVLAPLKSSVQNLQERLPIFLPNYRTLLVDSDVGGTTDPQTVETFLLESTPSIVFTTYESAIHVLHPIFQEHPELLQDAYVLPDEAHHITETEEEFITAFPAGLAMSATFPEEIKELLVIEEESTYYMPFSKAIEGNYICDYELWLPYATTEEVPVEFQHYRKDLAAKVQFLATTMTAQGKRRCIVYLSSQEECDQFMTIAEDMFENYMGLDVWTGKIDANVPAAKRKTLLEEFQNGPDSRYSVLTSVRILDEAIDVPRCDCVFITSVGEHSSDIRMVQRGMRSATLDPENPLKRSAILLWADGWESCASALDLLRESDPEFHKKIRVGLNGYDEQSDEKKRRKDEDREHQIIQEVERWSSMRHVSLWERRRLDWLEQYQKKGGNPSYLSKDNTERLACSWQYTQRRYYKIKSSHMTPERINILNNTPGWKWSEDDSWEQHLLQWIEQYNKLGKTPSGTSKDLEEKQAGKWQYTQRAQYHKKNPCMTPERITMLNNTLGWKWDVKDSWENNRLYWLQQHQKLGRAPSCSSNDPDEKKAAKWKTEQRTSYNKKDKRMTSERIETLNNTPGWKWSEDDNWEQNRVQWIEQYNKLGRKPYEKSKDLYEKQSGTWQSVQRQYYKNSKLTPERINTLNNMIGWTWEKEDNWEDNRLQWIEQYNKLGITPSASSKNSEEKLAGKWQSQQRTNYKKKEACMTPERITALENTPGWTWDNEDNWENNRLHWLEQYNKKVGKPSAGSKDPEEKRAGLWQHNQRTYYKNKKSYMTSERITALENTNGWTWGEEDDWEENRLHWIEQYNKKGGNPSAASRNLEEKEAGRWQQHQRHNYKKKATCLVPERISALNNTPGWKWGDKDNWEDNRLHWVEQYQKKGGKPSEASKDPEERQAGQWQSNQRNNYKKK